MIEDSDLTFSSSGYWFWSVFGTGLIHFFCLLRPILPPEMFESGKNIRLDPLP